MRLCLLTLLLAACTGAPAPEKHPDCDPVTRHRDADRDGYGDPATSFETCDLERGVEDATDCDDADPAVHPDAEETCDVEIDANCDGSTGYADNDGDGVIACEDCDDGDPTRNPSAAEFCDGIDEDCDGEVDEEPADGDTWYPDADEDGYGSLEGALLTCEQPDGYIEDPSDCDDTAADVSPVGTEVCDGQDNDCDGETDEYSAIDVVTWYYDVDGDGWGNADEHTIACDIPRGYAAESGDCDDEDPTVNPGGTEDCNGVDDDCDGGTDDAEALSALTWYLDGDGDGYGDSASTVLACDLPAGAAESGEDCDDADATVYPDADETCNDVDDDCDGDVDEDAIDATSWYTDADGDGYGDPATVSVTCDAPTDTIAVGDDCDDTDATVSPAEAESCDGVDQDCDGTIDDGASDASAWYADADSDGYGDPSVGTAACSAPAGYVATATDCDDAAAGVSPGGIEMCDGVDEDCDGVVDDGASDATTWYADADGDGHGDASVASTACSAPAGYVDDGGDCDDGDAAFHPGASEADCADPEDYNCDGSVGYADGDGDGFAACEECDDGDAAVSPADPERCNGVDDDCDGAADEDATDASDWYADADGDGFGDAETTSPGCDAPTGYVADASDCDDGDGTVSPGADETCATAGDDDCDGSTNDRNAEACTRWYWDYDGDGYGSTSNACQCEASGYLTADNADDCDDGDADVSPDGTEVWGNGLDDDCDDVTDVISAADADATLIGERSNDYSGVSLAGGDSNADGYDDLLVGAQLADTGGSSAGVAYLLLGPVTGEIDLGSADASFIGESSGDYAGYAVAGGGDVDGDGYDDFWVGAYGGGTSEQGIAYLVYGPASGALDLSAADASWTGDSRSDRAGYTIANLGDVDGDGADDTLVGATYHDAGGSASGAAYLLYGASTGANLLADAGALLIGEDINDYAGSGVASAGDMDGDGAPDLLVGAPGDDDGGSAGGAVYLVLGTPTGTVDLSAADAKFVGTNTSDAVGSVVDGAGDLDGDGLDDVLLGAAAAGGADGRAWLVAGGVTGTFDLADATAIFEGATNEALGTAVAGVGDVDGDGTPDLALGAPDNSDAAPVAGAVHLFFGPVSGTYTSADADSSFLGMATADGVGTRLAGVGDVDGDSVPDFMAGAPAADDNGTSSGSSYLFLGR